MHFTLINETQGVRFGNACCSFNIIQSNHFCFCPQPQTFFFSPGKKLQLQVLHNEKNVLLDNSKILAAGFPAVYCNFYSVYIVFLITVSYCCRKKHSNTINSNKYSILYIYSYCTCIEDTLKRYYVFLCIIISGKTELQCEFRALCNLSLPGKRFLCNVTKFPVTVGFSAQ